ncbi:MAG: ABC transporter permease [Chloroflexi bacterium]|nr:MAG: ABC transporter permease [Chloroflexota bacterium]
MTRYVLRRLIGMIPTLLVLLFIVVSLVRLLPGNVVDILLADGRATAETKAQLANKLGLDQSLPEAYIRYVGGVIRGDLGSSLWTDVPVTHMIMSRAPVTAEVAGVAILVSILISIPLGVTSAVRQDSFLDYALRSGSIAGISLPSFVVAQAIVVLPALWWSKSIPFQYQTFAENPSQHLLIILPASFVLGLRLSATIARMMRTTMLDVLQQDYMRTARAKGLTNFGIIVRHGLKNALIPVVTLLGLQFAALVGGSVITESMFALPGIGRLLLDAITRRDYPVIQGVVVSVGILVMATNLLVDLSYGYLDPRIRYS